MITALLFLVLAADKSPPVELYGKVVHVKDGDTLGVLVGKETIVVRLEGIDAPEKGQPFGTKSTQRLKELAHGKDVVMESKGKDRYGRTLGTVTVVESDVIVNETMIKDGFAWHYKQFSKDKALARLEVEARESKAGLWLDKSPLPPWEWRRERQSSPSKH